MVSGTELTGAVSELKAEVGPSEAVDGDGQLHHLAPAGAVVVVQDEGAVLTGVRLPAAQTDAVLAGEGVRERERRRGLTWTPPSGGLQRSPR